MNKPVIKNWFMIIFLASALIGCSPSLTVRTPTAAPPQPVSGVLPKPSIDLKPCTLGYIEAQCGVLTVYENRVTNTGRTIDIHVAVIKASEPNPAPDPIFYVMGGPGASGIDGAVYSHTVLISANRHRDLVLFDQRGTGRSNRMACPRRADENMGLVPFDDNMLQNLQTCLAGLNGDPAAYTTAWGMDDLDNVRAALGYERINLYGESYGPVAEQVYLQRYGDHVRTMTLEGVSLIDAQMFERMPRSSQEALDLLFARCQADPACNTAYPNLSAEVKSLIAQLEKQPVEIPLINPYTGQGVKITRDWLVSGIHSSLMRTSTAVLLPGLIHQAYLGNWNVAEKLVANNLAPDSSKVEWNIMNLVILCHEDWARVRRAETNQFSQGSYMGYEDVRRFLAPDQVCALIARPQPEALYESVTSSSVPVLIISDQADPQNPPENVAGAKEYYPNSLTIVAPGQGHGYTGIDCRDQILADFIEKGTTRELNTDCLQREPLPPINTD